MSDSAERWAFTFGFGHVHPVTGEPLANRFVVMPGTYEDARAAMVRRFGIKWAFQYAEPPRSSRVDLRELPESEWPPERTDARTDGPASAFDEAPTVVERPAAEALAAALADSIERTDEELHAIALAKTIIGAHNVNVADNAAKLAAANAKVETLVAELAEVSGLLLDVLAYADLSRSKAHPVRERVKAWRERLAARKRTTTYHMVGCDARDGLPCTHDCATHRYGPEKA